MSESDAHNGGAAQESVPDGPSGTRSELSGSAGDVVQARDIHGGVHFHGTAGGADGPSGRVPRELPGNVRGFVNRVVELARLDRLLSGDLGDPLRVHLLVIAGTAGVGKTSLALNWAHSLRDRFPDGQLYVNMRGYDPGPPVTPEQVLDRFLRAFDVPSAAIPVDLDARAALYRSLLADRRMLLVLDNAGTTAQVRPLLPGADGCFVVVTSRDRLSGLAVRDGAQRLTLDVFSEADAVNLLRTVTADYRAEDDAGELVELARLCARLPLALRIAAERAARRPRMLLQELIDDLRDESELWETLAAEDGEGADAVRTVFAWSYRALPEDAARLFRLLGLHPGPDFSDHAAAVLGRLNVRQARRRLDALVGAHLLEQTAHDRYQFHDLLRAYATDRARFDETSDECRQALVRILTWYLHTANAAQAAMDPRQVPLQIEPPGPDAAPLAFAGYDEAIRWYEAERANLVAATRTAAAEGLHRIAWQLAAALRRIYVNFNAFEDWIITSRLGLDAARADDDRRGEADLHESLARAYAQSHRLDEAAEHYRAALAIRRELGDTLGEALGWNGLGLLARRRRRFDEARASYERSAEKMRELADPYWEAVVMSNLGRVYLDLDRTAEATDLVQRALDTFREQGDRGPEGNALCTLSMIHRASGRAAEAWSAAREAVDIALDELNLVDEGYWLIEFGHAQRATGSPGDALVSYQRAASVQRRLGDRSREAEAWDGAGLAYQELDRPSDAVPFHRLAAAAHRALGDTWQAAAALDHLATALRAAHAAQSDDAPDVDEVRRQWQDALTLLADFDDPQAVRLRTRISETLAAL